MATSAHARTFGPIWKFKFCFTFGEWQCPNVMEMVISIFYDKNGVFNHIFQNMLGPSAQFGIAISACARTFGPIWKFQFSTWECLTQFAVKPTIYNEIYFK
jgi:hypothetical protein